MDIEELTNELEKLRNSEKHYRILMDESMEPTFSFYADGTYRYVNNAFAAGVGKSRGEIIGHKIWDVFEKDEADKRYALVKKVFKDIKTLAGLLPICSSCKKIRDDKGYWNQIESYISEHSKAEFSHGICPECAKELYPDFHIDQG